MRAVDQRGPVEETELGQDRCACEDEEIALGILGPQPPDGRNNRQAGHPQIGDHDVPIGALIMQKRTSANRSARCIAAHRSAVLYG
jgi:hypothetical protein